MSGWDSKSGKIKNSQFWIGIVKICVSNYENENIIKIMDFDYFE